jgi:hypothetical protein
LNEDGEFDDLTFEISLADGESIPLGAGLQGGKESEVIDLQDFEGQNVQISVEVHREALLDNRIGFFLADDAQGTVGNLDPLSANYVQEAAAQWQALKQANGLDQNYGGTI